VVDPGDVMLFSQPHPGARQESLGATTATSRGTTITTANSNAKGSWVDLGTTSFSYHHLTICTGATSAAADYLVDIGVNVGGNRFVIIPDLRVPSIKGANLFPMTISIPLRIPKGSVLSARCSASTNSATVTVCLTGFSGSLWGFPGFSRCVALFTSPGTSKGVNIDFGATGFVLSGWQQVVASTPERVGGVFCIVGPAGNVAKSGVGGRSFEVGYGAAGAEHFNGPVFLFTTETIGDSYLPCAFGPYPCDLAKASRIAVRGSHSGDADAIRDFDLAMYGLVF
jgi:hypothetical protein